MGNKLVIENKAKELGFVLGCWDPTLDKLSKVELNKVLGAMKFEEDTDVKINRKNYVVQIDIVDADFWQIDFNVITRDEYISRYGNERYDND